MLQCRWRALVRKSDIKCSSPVTEDVPPRRDRSIHGVYPCTPPPWLDWFIRGAYIQSANYTQRCNATTITLCSISWLETSSSSSLPSSSTSSSSSSTSLYSSRLSPSSISSSVKSLSSFSSTLLLTSSTEVEYVCAVASPCVFTRSCFWFWLGPGGVVFRLRLKVPDGAAETSLFVH